MFANGMVIPLINFAPSEFATATRVPVIPGQNLYLYLDPSDPLFAVLASPLAAALDANGNYRPAANLRIAFPRLPRQLLFWYW